NGELGVYRSVVDDLRAANVPGVKSVQPLVVERVYLPDQDNRAAVLVGAELSLQMVNADNPLGVRFTETLERNWATAKLAVTRRPGRGRWSARRRRSRCGTPSSRRRSSGSTWSSKRGPTRRR